MRYVCMMLACLLMVGCQEEELVPDYGEGVGYLRLKLGKVDVELSSTTKAEAGELPDELVPTTTDDFMVDVKMGKNSVEGFPKRYSEIGTEGIALNAGTYTVTAYHGENELIQTEPYFEGSASVEIFPGERDDATITASLANAMLKPAVSASLQNHYSDWTLTVEVGDASLKLADNKSSDGYLFAKAGQEVKAVFEGTNLLENETSQEWTVVSPAKAQTKYVIQCDPDLSISFGLKAVAQHTTDDSGYLNGTKVSLSFDNLSNVPVSLILDWKATLVNASGEEVRSYSTSDFTNAEMVEANGWTYLPQGNYTLKYSYTIDGETVSEDETVAQTITMPQPTFNIELSAQTSYSVYTSQGAAAANETDGSGIFDIVATTNISQDILGNEKYANLLTITYTLDTGESTTDESPVFQNLQWGKRTLTAFVMFDGSNDASSIDCDVTGIPYRGNYSSTSPFDDTKNPWICVGDGEYWEDHGYILFQYYKTIFWDDLKYNCYVFSPAFQVPNMVDISYSTKVVYFTTGSASRSIEVYTGVSERTDNNVKDKTESIDRVYVRPGGSPDENQFTIISDNTTIGNNYRVCISHDGQEDENQAENWLTFKSLEVLYR